MTITPAPADQFDGHVAGEPYELTRKQFIRFAGLQGTYEQMLQMQPGWQWSEEDRQRAALWAAIAQTESLRTFNPLAQLCHSELEMDTEGGAMRWWYQSTSGTELEIIEHRELLTWGATGYPGVECSMELPSGSYRVTIPVDRDQPERYHHEQLRRGGTYCD